jgi:hypothetical protein
MFCGHSQFTIYFPVHCHIHSIDVTLKLIMKEEPSQMRGKVKKNVGGIRAASAKGLVGGIRAASAKGLKVIGYQVWYGLS